MDACLYACLCVHQPSVNFINTHLSGFIQIAGVETV